MRVASDRIRELAEQRGLTLSALLARAGISRNAYYSLRRRRSVLPRTLRVLARALDVPESELLDEAADGLPEIVITARRICAADPNANFQNVWHTLALLEMEPVDRLNRSLTRGRATAIHK